MKIFSQFVNSILNKKETNTPNKLNNKYNKFNNNNKYLF